MTNTLLILGGGGMFGVQVAREAANVLKPSRIVLGAVRAEELSDAVVEPLRNDFPHVKFDVEIGDIFLPQSLQGINRRQVPPERYDELFASIFARDADPTDSFLYKLIDKYKPDVVVDSVNTASGISYLDEFEVSRKVKAQLDAIESRSGAIDRGELQPLIDGIRELLVVQGLPQIARHILILHRALDDTSVRIYVKVGTTGTGGMGINIPYTHSEEKPSTTLLSKSAVGFAQTGLLFLLARTPIGERECIVKEVKPGAMIGFRKLGVQQARSRDEGSLFLVNARDEEIGDTLQLRDARDSYGDFEDSKAPLQIVGADTGENGFFSIGEFQAITYPRQMEYVTPEEVARTVVLEILGSSTGRDVLAAIDGAITEPSYRAGVLRDAAIHEMERLQKDAPKDVLPSIAIGELGPPTLSKLLVEAHLIREAAGTDDLHAIRAIAPEEMRQRVEQVLANDPRLVSQIVTIGLPILRMRNGKRVLSRGPRISIPPKPADGTVVALDDKNIERYASSGWVDLRIENFERWQQRLGQLRAPNFVERGSAALEVSAYPAGARFVPGDIVGWVLTNEPDQQGMVGRRLF